MSARNDIGKAIEYALHQLERGAENKSAYADAILDFWQLDQEMHRFQIHARVFKGMDLIGYIAGATTERYSDIGGDDG